MLYIYNLYYANEKKEEKNVKIISIDNNLCFAMKKIMSKNEPKICIASYKINDKEEGPLHCRDHLGTSRAFYTGKGP